MSFFHKFKKAVVSHHEAPGTSLSAEYDAVKVEFEGLYDAMLRLRQQLLNYREANGRLWTSASTLSLDFATMLDVGDHHPYTAMASTLKASHTQLPSERERVDVMLNGCLDPMKDLVAKYDLLRQRMTEHDKVKDEVVYYQTKVEGLKKSRAASTKPESQSEKDKYERNVKKLMDQEAAFHTMDALLVQDLKTAYAQRVLVFGPIMLAFVLAEKQQVKSYDKAINEVQLVNYDEEKAWVASHPANLPLSPRTQAQVQATTTTTTTVTDLHSPTSPPVDLLAHYGSVGAPVAGAGTATTAGLHVSEPVPTSPPRFPEHDFMSPTAASPSAPSYESASVPYTMSSASTHIGESSTSYPNGTSSASLPVSSAHSVERPYDAFDASKPSASSPVHDLMLESSKPSLDHPADGSVKEGEKFEKVDLSSPIGSHNL